METVKRTYSLPVTVVQEFETRVDPADRNEVVGDLLGQWAKKRRKERLRREVIEGCREMGEVYLDVAQEFHPLEEEAQRGLDAGD